MRVILGKGGGGSADHDQQRKSSTFQHGTDGLQNKFSVPG